ncbi:tyrosine-protein kinase JAK2-like isoform X2 [Lineus longissimus]|uniref:tyrosine-protein kinase JAK2-like isoform X2 n=1 Tax=Lineus longissimus TaxID=88925 RepID=UPI00315CC50F
MPSYLKESENSPKGTAPSYGIVVHVYKPESKNALPSDPHTFVTFTDTNKEYTFEKLCIETAKKCKIGPSALQLFGLVSLKDYQLWPPLSFSITPPANERLEYVFRIRYKPLLEKLNTIWLRDKEVFMYLYYQMLDDFVTERLSDMYFQKLEQEQQLGHALNALVMYGKINKIPMEKLRNDYTLYLKFLPKSCKQDFKALTPKLRLQSSLKSWVETEYNDKEKEKAELHCHCFMHDLLAKQTEYMMERYEVDSDRTKVLFIDHKGVYSSSGGKKPETLLWTIDEVMSGHLNAEKGALITLRHTPPKVFSFPKKEYAESFLAALDGYYRLIVNYYHQLCMTMVSQVSQYISPRSLKKLKDLRWHGPIRYEDACNLLKDKEVGAYIVKQDTARFDTHAITAKLQGRPKPCTIPFRYDENDKIIVNVTGKDVVFSSFEEMLKNYELTERLRPTEDDKSLLLCKSKKIQEELDPDMSPTASVGKGPRQVTCALDSSLDIAEVVGKGVFTQVLRGKFHRGDADLEVALKKISDGVHYSDIGHLMEALQQGVHRAMQWSNPNILKVHAVCLSSPFRAVIEYAPQGSLNDYLRTVNEPIYLTHLYTAAYYLSLALSYLDEVKIPHGNIRCRNVLVLWHNEMEVKVKLGDPGLSSLYSFHRISDPVNQERSPWLAPELKDPLVPTIHSDIYAFGTTLWEIFMFGELPRPNDTQEDRLQKLRKNVDTPDAIFELLNECWEENVEKRKNTQEIIRDFWAMILAVDPQYGTYYTIADDEEESSGMPDLQRLQQNSAASWNSSNAKNPLMKKPMLTLGATKPLDNHNIPRLSPPPTPKESFLVRLPMTSGGGSMMYGSQSHFRFDAPNPHNVSSSTFGSLMSPTSSLHSLHVDTSFGATSTTPLLGMISPEGQGGFSPSSGATITPPIHSGMSGDSTMDSQEPLLPPKRRDMPHFQSHQNQHGHHNSHNPNLVSPELPSPSTSCETIDTGNTCNSQQPLIKTRTDPPSLPRRKTQQHTNPNFRFSDSSQELDDNTRSLARSCDELSAHHGGRPLPTPPMQSHKLEYVIKRKLLIFGEKPKRLGSGNYGSVFRATLLPDKSKVDWETTQPEQVAVKILYKQEDKYRKEFEHEIDLMTNLKHENIVKIVGMCLEHKDQPLLLVMEYVENGSLHRYLRKQRNSTRPKMMDQLTWCLEILEGMLYLWEQKVVHRDLATRNVLVTKDISMKISDFGLARTLDPERDYYKCRNPKAEIPALWCAPEGLEYRKFTTKGDVWSYGVTVWEIFSLGKRPILCEDFKEMLNKLQSGVRLDRPAMCPRDVFEKILLTMCWEYNDDRRADLPQVYLKLRELIAAKEQESSSEDVSSICTETTDQTHSPESPDNVSEAAADAVISDT